VGFSYFILIAVMIAVTGIPALRTIVKYRAAIFDRHLTPNDRVAVDQAAFFILLPISVALHELGHAIMVWSFGGKVTGFGFFLFAGYVNFEGALTDTQHILIAMAGPAVNVLLAVLAVAFVLLKRRPMRAAYNELLVQFAILSVANALLFYPAIDFLFKVNGGDFRQMYFGGVPWLSRIILVGHLSFLALGWYMLRGDWPTRKLGALTELPPGVHRGIFGGFRMKPGGAPAPAATEPPVLTPFEIALRDSLRRVASGWDTPVGGALVRSPRGPALIASWKRDATERAVSVVQEASGAVAVMVPPPGVVQPPGALTGRVWQRWAEPPGEDQLVLAIRIAMEAADSSSLTPAPTNGLVTSR
jgi:hypothetical protein